MSRTLLINPTAMEAGLVAAARARALGPSRAAAFDAFAKTGLPHRRLEGWKWTDLRAALRDGPGAAAPDNDVIAPSIFGGVRPFEITIMNGAAEWSGAPPDGVAVSLQPSETAPSAPTGHPLADLALAMSDERLVVSVAAGAQIARPILLRRIAGAGAHHAIADVALGPNAQARVIESFHGVGRYFSNSLVAFRLDEGASLERFLLQDASAEGVETAVAIMRLSARARLRQTSLALGGRAVRLEARIACEGEGADLSLANASLFGQSRHADVTTHVRLAAPDCVVRQMHKAALAGRGQGVFQGKFHCERAAQKTDAQMQAHALLLSGEAEADHKPELEIYADDVKMSHGSTAGALDADALFYLRQRGLDERAARAMLTEAFIGTVFDGVADEAVQQIFRRRAALWLESAS